VKHTAASWTLFGLLKQRELRWFRFNPQGKFAAIRAGVDLPKQKNGDLIELKATCHLPGWMYVSRFFQTGPFVGFRDVNRIEDQIEWLKAQQPDYLLGFASSLEHLAFAFQGEARVQNLKGIQTVSQQLTGEMRRRIERTF